MAFVAPLKGPFRPLIIASFAANAAMSMQAVGTTWLLVTLTSSASLIALHQAAGAAPIFLVVLVAGALADLLGRRRILAVGLSLMAVAAVGVATFVTLHLSSPLVVLAFVFLLGVGSALMMPATAAALPELVPEEELAPASSLLGAAAGLAAAVAPALAGVVINLTSFVVIFAIDAALFIGAAVALTAWRKRNPGRDKDLPPEPLLHAIRLGLGYGRHGGAFAGLLVRTGLFALLVTAAIALLPAVLHLRLSVGPAALGTVLGTAGMAAMIGALSTPYLRTKMSSDTVALVGTLLAAVGLFGLAVSPSVWLVGCSMFLVGFGQSLMTTTVVTIAAHALPEWVRSRGVALYILAWYLATTLGSVLWGLFASAFALTLPLLVAASSTAALAVAARLWPLRELAESHSATNPWDLCHPASLPDPPKPNAGPVLVLFTYQVAPDHEIEFVAAMQRSAPARRRAGLMQWRLYRDVDHADRFIEVFVAQSWAEHLRQRERMTVDELHQWGLARPLFTVLFAQHFVVHHPTETSSASLGTAAAGVLASVEEQIPERCLAGTS